MRHSGMTEGIPSSIRYFEVLSCTSFVIGFIHAFMVTGEVLAESMFAALIPLGLTLLVSRRHKNWARWALTVLFVLGMAFSALNFRFLLTAGYPVITLAVFLLQGVGLALLFTSQSSSWLRKRQSAAETFR
jgi:hypothetical protein